MKRFVCGDVVPGCDASFVCGTDDEILTCVAEHAVRDHGLAELSPELVAAVRGRIVSVG